MRFLGTHMYIGIQGWEACHTELRMKDLIRDLNTLN